MDTDHDHNLFVTPADPPVPCQNRDASYSPVPRDGFVRVDTTGWAIRVTTDSRVVQRSAAPLR